MVEAIFFDIDGTLISKKNPRISIDIKKALQALREQGILLFIATGRHYQEIANLKLTEDFQFDGYITLNGCYCYNQDKVIYKAVISPLDVKSLVSMVGKTDIACMFVEVDRMYINKVNTRVTQAHTSIGTSLPDREDITRALENDIYQVLPYVTTNEASPFLEATKDCMGTSWHPLAYDVMPTSGGKVRGIKAFLAYYNISVEATMAFGDGYNDIDMLKFVNIGICMGNGEVETKNSSDYITANVDESGILIALSHYRLLP